MTIRRKAKRSQIVREIQDSWAFAVERARKRGNPGTLFHRIDKAQVYWRQHAPDGMPQEFFNRHFRACFTQAVLFGDPDFFAVMDRASGLLSMLFARCRPRPAVLPPKDEEMKNRMRNHKSGLAWGSVTSASLSQWRVS